MWIKKGRLTFPDDECLTQGTKLMSRIARGVTKHSGTVVDGQNNTCWRYADRDKPSRRTLRNPFKKPDFVALEKDSQKEIVIRRASFVPCVFQVIESGATIGTIRMLSVFRNKYSISIDGADSWTFHMPLYTILFFAESKSGAGVGVAVGPSQMEWSILLEPGVPQRPIVAALSFIHTERYFYS